MKKKSLWVAILITMIAALHPIIQRWAYDYRAMTFKIGPEIVVNVGFLIMAGLLVNVWFYIEKREKLLIIIFAILNMAIAYYLFWCNSYTLGRVPGYTIMFAMTLFFDFIFSCFKK